MKAGNFYKTFGGEKTLIYVVHENGEFPVHGAVCDNSTGIWNIKAWTKSGKFNTQSSICHNDIIGEWVEPHPAEKWPVDAEILVRDEDDEWVRRHFAKYENGMVYVWNVGTTSWTADGLLSSWKQAKLAD